MLGKSIRARIAESEGKLPLYKAVRAVAQKYGVSQRVARQALLDVGPCEWHHVGWNWRATDYYNTEDTEIEDVLLREGKLPEAYLKRRLRELRHQQQLEALNANLFPCLWELDDLEKACARLMAGLVLAVQGKTINAKNREEVMKHEIRLCMAGNRSLRGGSE